MFDPGGTEFESGAVYEAIDVSTGEIVELFRRGNGLRLSPDGRWIGFARTEGNPDRDRGMAGRALVQRQYAILRSAANGRASDDARQRRFRDEALGVEFQYPGSWTDGSGRFALRLLFRLPGRRTPERRSSLRHHPVYRAAFAGLRADLLRGESGAADERGAIVDRGGAPGETGRNRAAGAVGARERDGRLYAVSGDMDARAGRRSRLFVVAFYRSDDASAEGEAKAAYEIALSSLAFPSDRSLQAVSASYFFDWWRGS